MDKKEFVKEFGEWCKSHGSPYGIEKLEYIPSLERVYINGSNKSACVECDSLGTIIFDICLCVGHGKNCNYDCKGEYANAVMDKYEEVAK